MTLLSYVELISLLANELLAFSKDKQLHVEEIEPDYLDWSDLDKEDL